jgi:hypothetical protein
MSRRSGASSAGTKDDSPKPEQGKLAIPPFERLALTCFGDPREAEDAPFGGHGAFQHDEVCAGQMSPEINP